MTAEIDITEFLPATVWVTERGGRVFQSMGQFDWFRRRYRRELVASGQFISGSGRRADLCGPRLGVVIADLMRNEQVAGERETA